VSVAHRFRRTLQTVACGAALALMPCTEPSSTACAAPDESALEARLRAASVRADLRARVLASVERGVAHLAGRIRDDGQFPDDDGGAAFHNRPDSRSRVETTALAAWALAATASEGGAASSDRALAALLPGPRSSAPELRVRVLAAAFTVLALAARGGNVATQQELARRLQGFQDEKSGYWSYAMVDGGTGGWNLFTSHFAALALRASSTPANRPWDWVWRRHAAGALRSMRPDGVWGFAPDGADAPCPVGTCLGLFALTVAREGLDVTDEDEDEVLRAWIDRPLPAVERAFDRDAAIVLGLARGEWRRPDWMARAQPGTSVDRPESHLDLLCMATACMAAAHEELEGQSWYELATELLLDRQNADGGWGRTGALATGASLASRVDETSYALLVLTRATGRTSTPETAGRRLQSIAVDTAWPLLDEFEQLLGDARAPVALAQASLDDVRHAYTHLAPAPGKHDSFADDARRWRQGADLLLIRALAVQRAVTPTNVKEWRRFRLDAARALAGSERSASAALRGSLERELLAPGVEPPDGLLAAAFAALARQGDPVSAEWLVQWVRPADASPPAIERAVIALRALAQLERIPGTHRLLVATRLVEEYGGSARGREPRERRAESVDARIFTSMESGVVRALRHLCRDARTRRIEGAAFEQWSSTFDDLAKWLVAHSDPEEPPWR
jgi:hypothetical protein